MPLGDIAWASGEGGRTSVIVPTVTPGQRAPYVTAAQWRNFTITTPEWVNGVIGPILFGVPMEIVELLSLGGDPLLVSWQGPPSNTAGGYQLRHPGGQSQLVEVVPDVSQIWLATTTGAAPSNTVELIARAGRFGLQAGTYV